MNAAKRSFPSLKQYIKTILLSALLTFFVQIAIAQNTPEEKLISLPIGANNDYKLENQPQSISLTFNHPLIKTPEDFSRTLPDFIEKQELSANNTRMFLTLRHPLITQTSLKDGILSISLKPHKDAVGAAKSNHIAISYGEHPDYYRFVFKYNQPPLYSVKSQDMQTSVYFLNDVRLQTEELKSYPFYPAITVSPNTMGGQTLTIPAAMVKSAEYDNKIVIDVSKVSEGRVFDDSTAEIKIAGINLPETNSSAQENMTQKPPYNDKRIISLGFSWNSPANIAVFRRENYLWIIFDQRKKIDKEQLLADAAPLAEEIVLIPHTKATVIRLKTKPNVNAGLRKEGLLWIIDLSVAGFEEKIKDMNVFTRYDSLNHPYFFIATTMAGNIISVVDPEIGDNLIAATVSDVESGISAPYSYPDFDFLRSLTGVAVVPKNTDLNIERGNTGIIVKAVRGLNISADLDYKKRQQDLLNTTEDQLGFDLNVSAGLAGMSYAEAVSQLKKDIEQAPQDKKNAARLMLVRYYISNGLGAEALQELRRLSQMPGYRPTEETESLFGVANFLLRRYDTAMEHLSFGNLPSDNQAVFWRTLSSAAKEYKKENNVILTSYISLIKDYPIPLKARIALVAADNALNAGDDLAAQNFIDVLNNIDSKNLYYQARIGYLTAKRRVLQGYPRNGIKLYNNIATSLSQKYSALARYEAAVLGQKLGMLPLAKAIRELEQLYYAWPDTKFRLQVLRTLADYYVRSSDYLSALRKLNLSMSLEAEDEKPQTLKRMVNILEDVYINNRADNLPPLKSLAIYKEFEWLAPQSRNYNEIIRRLADRLVAVDLLPRAYSLLQNQLRFGRLSGKERAAVGTRLALISLFEDKNIDALDFLDQTQSADIDATLEAQRKIIRAKTLSNLDRDEEAIDLLRDDYSKNALLLKSEIYWNAGMWNEASDSIRYLVEAPQPGKPLSQEQIGYILDWATTLQKSGKTTVLVRLRNKFLPYFENTKYYSPFSILTGNLENDKIDLKAINQTINDVQAFSNFTKLYNDSLKNNHLDTQNK